MHPSRGRSTTRGSGLSQISPGRGRGRGTSPSMEFRPMSFQQPISPKVDHKTKQRELSELIQREGYLTFKKEDLQLHPDAPSVQYERRTLDEKTVGSWGQLKLFLGILEFICLFHKKTVIPKPLVLYIGAAPGLSFPLLSQMFPDFQWDLWDGADFGFEPNNKITIHKDYFYDKDAVQYKEHAGRMLFLSDIRTIDSKTNDKALVEETIWKDMLMQQEWVRIIKPVASNLKFRLPYGYSFASSNVNYLSGRVLLQAFTGPSSTETRLVSEIVDGNYEGVTWDINKYENQMFYHNAVVREKALYKVPVSGYNFMPDTDDITNNYDGCYMIYVFNLYLDYIGYPPNNHPPGTQEHENYNIERFNSAFALSLWVREYILSKRKNGKSFREIKMFIKKFVKGEIGIDEVDTEDLDDEDVSPIGRGQKPIPATSTSVPTVSLFGSTSSVISSSSSIPTFDIGSTPSFESILDSTSSELPSGFAQAGTIPQQSTSPKQEAKVNIGNLDNLLADLDL